MPGTIIVAGIPGVGKTTVLLELQRVAREKNVSVKIINFGDVMNKLLEKQGKDIHRDHIRRQDINLQRRIQQKAAKTIGNMKGNSSLVVDTHMFVRTIDGLWPGTPWRVLEALNPNLIVLIEAEPEEVAKRRATDTTRERESRNVDDAKADLQWSRYMASANAVLSGVPIQIVQNREAEPQQAAEKLLRMIENLRQKS